MKVDKKSNNWGGKRVKKVSVGIEQCMHEDAKDARYLFISNAVRVKEEKRSNDTVLDNVDVKSEVPAAVVNFDDE